jgi:hypothetical protein
MKDMNVKHVLLEVSTSGRGRVNREVKGELIWSMYTCIKKNNETC